MSKTNDMTIKYRISCDNNDIDTEKVYSFISDSYWAKGLPRPVFDKAINNSLCFSVIQASGTNVGVQVGFARMITDKAIFAYLADVFILPDHRGQGLSKQLIKFIKEHHELQGLRRVVLATADAHQLYRQFDFTPLHNPEYFMEVWQPKVYQNNLD